VRGAYPEKESWVTKQSIAGRGRPVNDPPQVGRA
jgi:hypothetical protein